MSDISTRRVSSLADGAAETLAEAFKNDPLLLPFVGGDLSLSPSLFKAFVTAAVVGGDAYFAEQAGDVVGVALWFGPGKEFLTSQAQREAGWDSFRDELSIATTEWQDTEYTPRLNALYSRSLPPSAPKTNHYHLACIGVHPAFQGLGIGTRLVQEGKERARLQRIHIYVDTATEIDVAIYKHWGFHICGAERITSMWRDVEITVMAWMLGS